MRILLTSGPTRQYIDPVRYISNASSGRMGCCLAEAFLDLGHEVVIVSGPVAIDYPNRAGGFDRGHVSRRNRRVFKLPRHGGGGGAM